MEKIIYQRYFILELYFFLFFFFFIIIILLLITHLQKKCSQIDMSPLMTWVQFKGFSKMALCYEPIF